MTSTLAKAIKDKRPIVVTGWTPHWMFTKFDLKFLEDPKGSFGKAENIHTIVRKDLKKMNQRLMKSLIVFIGLLKKWLMSCYKSMKALILKKLLLIG